MRLINIGWLIMFIGVVIVFYNMGKENIDSEEFMTLTSPLLIGGVIVIFCRLTGRDEEE